MGIPSGVVQNRGKSHCDLIHEVRRASKSENGRRHLKGEVRELRQKTWEDIEV